jgi:filamentous hemagglutinin
LAVVPVAKVLHYLLDSTHPGNGGKAAFFGAFGFTVGRWAALHDALLAHPGMHPVIVVTANAWGTKYDVRCSLRSPDGRNPCIRSIWVIDATSPYPRLVTAYGYP